MLRLFEYNTPDNYKDFRNDLFTLHIASFDHVNDKVSIAGKDYRISTIQEIGNNMAATYPNVIADKKEVVQAGTNIVFPYELGSDGDSYSLYAMCYDANGIIGADITNRTKSGFTVTPLRNGTFEFIAVLNTN